MVLSKGGLVNVCGFVLEYPQFFALQKGPPLPSFLPNPPTIIPKQKPVKIVISGKFFILVLSLKLKVDYEV
jgi:hypothetical protein